MSVLSPLQSARRIVLAGGTHLPTPPPKPLTYLWRRAGDQLFIVDDPIRSHELRKLAGGRVLRDLTSECVAFRRANEPFKDEINLCRS